MLHQAFSTEGFWVIFGLDCSPANNKARIEGLMSARTLFFTVLSLLAVSACGPVSEESDQSQLDTLRAEVQKTLSDLTEAMNQHDPDAIFRYYRSGEEFLYLGCTDVLLGWRAFSIRVGSYYRANPDVTFQQEVIRIQVLSPSVAVAALRGSSSDAEALFWTQVLVKEDGEWRITYEHESWPGCSPPPVAHPFTVPSDSVGLLPSDSVGP
jgi:hypothetical protein